MTDGKKTEELACPALDCGVKIVVTVEQIADGARVKCSNGHEFRLGGAAGASTAPKNEAEWRRTNKQTIRLENSKIKKDD